MASLHIPIHQRVFDNGLRVVIAPNHKSPVACLSVGYKVGSKDEHRGKTGFAHLFEHLMFDGSANVARGEYDAYLSAAGGQCNAYTAYDQTIYHEVVPSHQLELALWLESDRMVKCGVRQIGLETQQKVIIEEIGQTVEDQPYGRWREAQAAVAYAPECSYSWEVYGSKADVAAATMDDVREFFGTFYRPDNACVVVAGDVCPEEAFRLAERYFGDIPRGNGTPPRNKFLPEYRRNGYVCSEDNVPLAATVLSYHYGGMNDDNYLTGAALASIAGDGRSARIYDALTRRRQLASSVYVYPDLREHTSLLTFMAIAATPEISCEELGEALHQEISGLATDGVSSHEIGKARNSLATSLAYILQTSAGAADAITAQTLFWEQPDRVNTILDRYAALSDAQLNDFVRETLHDDNCVRTDIVPS
ncbi:pitrilysin family protein [Ignavibacteria bacterium]|nr:insulinase family protein [Bacteroidota bacterium]MCZ2133074.1 insulinase family protein [Bacteroidota bacterium]